MFFLSSAEIATFIVSNKIGLKVASLGHIHLWVVLLTWQRNWIFPLFLEWLLVADDPLFEFHILCIIDSQTFYRLFKCKILKMNIQDFDFPRYSRSGVMCSLFRVNLPNKWSKDRHLTGCGFFSALKKKWSQNGPTLEPFWKTMPLWRVELFFLRIFFTKSKYPTFRQKTSMHNSPSHRWMHAIYS